MKRTGIFLIPTVYAAGGKLPMDYQFTEREIDRRTRFWKINKKREASLYRVAALAERHDLRMTLEYGPGVVFRIQAPNGKAALAFYNDMKLYGWED